MLCKTLLVSLVHPSENHHLEGNMYKGEETGLGCEKNSLIFWIDCNVNGWDISSIFINIRSNNFIDSDNNQLLVSFQ